MLHLADSEARGWEELRPHAWHTAWKYGDIRRSSTRPGPPPPAPALALDREQAIRERVVITGPSAYVVERLQAIKQAAEVPVEFVARSYHPTMERPEQLEIMQRLAEEVAPHL